MQIAQNIHVMSVHLPVCISVCLYVYLSTRNNSVATRQTYTKFYTRDFHYTLSTRFKLG